MSDGINHALQANIDARKDAEESISFIENCYDTPQRFWEIIAEHAAKKLPAKPAPVDPLPAMTEGEAIAFESREVPYGKWAGYEVGQVDCEYLIFLTEGDEFSKRIRRYVKSKRFQDRQEN